MDWFKHTPWLTTLWLENPVYAWLIALIGAIVGFLIVSAVLRIAANRLEKLHMARLAGARDVVLTLLRKTRRWLILLLALSLAAGTLKLSVEASTFLHDADAAFITLQVALWASALIRLWARRRAGITQAGVTAPAGMLVWGTELVVWSILLVVFLGNIGVQITALVASLGVGGIAIGFAAKNILGDLFASIAIGLDKPYVVGEFIAFRSVLGTVIKLGIKSTRLTSLSGEELSIANSVLAQELVHNYSRMPQRRIVFGFRICYGATSAQVQEIVASTRAFIESEEKVRFDRGHFIAFGEYGYDFEFVYYVLDSNYTLYRDIQQRVNFKLMDLLDRQGTAFAIPARQIVHTSPMMAGLPPAQEEADSAATHDMNVNA